MKKTMSFFCAFVLLSLSASATTMIRRINLEQMTLDAQTIFVGKCVSVEAGLDENGLPSTQYRFEIQQTLKGSSAETRTIKQFGISSSKAASSYKDIPIMKIDGMPQYNIGDSYLLFLSQSGKLGFSSPQGLSQGAFHAYMDPATKKVMAVNGIGNAELFSGIRQKTGSRLRESSDLPEKNSPVLLKDLIQAVQEILLGK